ncbi:MAG TPA: enoyl-CoA hydratase/isomerase family protein, partial [Pilimelia sp.]|nr:enoyl-CoA hydratase/isomerase family protein [Pilimelia sp.]
MTADGALRTTLGGDGVATLTLDRPARRNALTTAMWGALPGVLGALAADPRVRALVVTGAGATFSAGADIGDLRRQYADPVTAEAFHAANVAAEEALAGFPRPTVAAVAGACVGGGCQLAVACDVRFADRGAFFAVPPARLGVVYPASATVRLARLVGHARARYLLYSAATVDAARARLSCAPAIELASDGPLDLRIACPPPRKNARAASCSSPVRVR